MVPVILFVLCLVVSFGVLFFFLKPTKAERAVEQQLAGIQENRVVVTEGPTILKEEQRSSAPWLDQRLLQLPGASTLSALIKQGGQKWQLSTVFFSSLAAAIIVGWLGSIIFSSVGLGFLAALAAALAPCLYLYILRQVRFTKFDNLLPEAVDLMARGLRAGHAVNAVLEMVATEVADPVGAEFRTLHEQQILGLPARDAMMNLVHRMPSDDMRFLATAILLQKETGGNLVQILDKTAAVMRERSRLRGQLRIYTAQGRITGLILCIAPFIMFALIGVVNPSYEKVLFKEPLGQDMIYAGLTMMLIGILIIRKVIDIKV
jgi:tight adherence protein B